MVDPLSTEEKDVVDQAFDDVIYEEEEETDNQQDANGETSADDFINSFENQDRGVIKLILFFLYCVGFYFVGIAYFCGAEEYTFLESLYFSTITISTVGYGDFTPQHHRAKIFTTFFVILGVIVTGYGVNAVATLIFEEVEEIKMKHERRIMSIMNKVVDIKLAFKTGLQKIFKKYEMPNEEDNVVQV